MSGASNEQESSAYTWDDFEKIECLGEGTFGKVWKVRNKGMKINEIETRVIYVIKSINA